MNENVRGLLLDEELNELVISVRRGSSLDALDELATKLLLKRSALTAWEEAQRTRGSHLFFIGNYRIFAAIARGETYEVLKGQHVFTGKIHAIKILRRSAQIEGSLWRHLSKLRVLCLFESPHIVSVHEVGYSRGADFATVEIVDGADLRQCIRGRGAMRTNAAARMGADLAVALDAVHKVGFVHGSLQPTKVLVGDSMNATLCDAGTGIRQGEPLGTFGSARAIDFASPEAVAGEALNQLSDIYSLGCVLYYAVTGKVPFPGGTASEKRAAHLTSYPLDPRRLQDNLDDTIVGVLAEMMKKEPSDRPQSMDVVASRLRSLAAG